MNLLIIVTLLSNIHPMLFPYCIQYDILLLIQVMIYLFHHLVLQHIYGYILRIPITIKHIKIHTFYKQEILSNLRIPINSQQFALLIFRKCDIGSSISTSSFKLKKTSKEELIYFFYLYYNWMRNLFLPTTLWTHPTTSLCILLLLPFLVIFSNSPTLAFTTDPIPIFFLVWFFVSIPYLTVTTSELMVDWGGGGVAISLAIIELMVDLLFVRTDIPTTTTKITKNSPGVENQ